MSKTLKIKKYETDEQFANALYKYLMKAGEIEGSEYDRQMVYSDVYNLRATEWLENLEWNKDTRSFFIHMNFVTSDMCKKFIECELTSQEYLDMLNESGLVSHTISSLDELENFPLELWDYPLEEKDYCLEEKIPVVLIKNENRYYEIPKECFVFVDEKINSNHKKPTLESMIKKVADNEKVKSAEKEKPSFLEVKTIETDKYERIEGTNRVKFIGMITADEAFTQLKEHLEKVNLLPDEYFSINFSAEGRNLPNFDTAICYVSWGGSEGIYVDIDLRYFEQGELRMFNLATGKTLGESGDAYIKMSRIAAECSMMLNGRGSIVKVSEKNYENIDKSVSVDKRISFTK